MTVRRVDDFPQNDIHFSFPAVVELDAAASVQAVAAAACTLPVMPPGRYDCAADLGIDYVLTFADGTTTLAKLTVAATGCQTVTGLSQTRWEPDPLFNALAQALHLAAPYDQTFRGASPS